MYTSVIVRLMTVYLYKLQLEPNLNLYITAICQNVNTPNFSRSKVQLKFKVLKHLAVIQHQ